MPEEDFLWDEVWEVMSVGVEVKVERDHFQEREVLEKEGLEDLTAREEARRVMAGREVKAEPEGGGQWSCCMRRRSDQIEDSTGQ